MEYWSIGFDASLHYSTTPVLPSLFLEQLHDPFA